MSSDLLQGFFAYPSVPPSIGESIREAIKTLKTAHYELTSWESLCIGGKYVIDTICQEIDGSDLFCADVTFLNPNVAFELGYAIAKNLRIWLILDTSYATAKRDWDHFKALAPIGYNNYTNSREIVQRFYADSPFNDLKSTIYEDHIHPSLTAGAPDHILYLKSLYENEASIRVGSELERTRIPLRIDDPKEHSSSNLVWYAKNIHSSRGVLCHISSPERTGSAALNARYALVAGVAYGFGKPLLMLCEGDYLGPFDYRELARHYATAHEARLYFGHWIDPIIAKWKEDREDTKAYASRVSQAAELKGLNLGDPIAENEADQLLSYFVDTSAYQKATQGHSVLFVGRKGCGKSALLYKLESDLRDDRRNVTAIMKPVAYEVQAVVRLLSGFAGIDEKGFAIESLWKFLLLTELGNSVANEIEARRPESHSPDDKTLLFVMNQKYRGLRNDFSLRLDQCVNEILTVAGGAKSKRIGISETLHSGVIKDLRDSLRPILERRERVTILIDNLDKAWDKSSDLDSLSRIFLGLLGATQRVSDDFLPKGKHAGVSLQFVIFLRSDIFYAILPYAREPDKISRFDIDWSDESALLRVIDERLVASSAIKVPAEKLWDKFFCATVKGHPTPHYCASRVLPRPRDLVLLIKEAVSIAVNRGHPKVEEDDLASALKGYSQFAVESLVVEGSNEFPQFEEVIYQFIGSSAYVSHEQVYDILKRANVPANMHEAVLNQLCALGMLGLEVHPSDYTYADDAQEYRRALVLARKLAEERKDQLNYCIHRAFWPFLDIAD